jgi:hypothetical protein
MPTQITINTLTGLPPFDVYTCDTGYTTCVYVSTIGFGQIPYAFMLPFIQEGMNPIGLRVIDSANCIIDENLTL